MHRCLKCFKERQVTWAYVNGELQNFLSSNLAVFLGVLTDEVPFPGMEFWAPSRDLRLYLATVRARNRTSIISYPRADNIYTPSSEWEFFIMLLIWCWRITCLIVGKITQSPAKLHCITSQTNVPAFGNEQLSHFLFRLRSPYQNDYISSFFNLTATTQTADAGFRYCVPMRDTLCIPVRDSWSSM